VLGLVTQVELAQFGLLLLVICDTHSTATFRMVQTLGSAQTRNQSSIQRHAHRHAQERTLVAMFSIHRQALLAVLRYEA
jgi:hypothetical protein